MQGPSGQILGLRGDHPRWYHRELGEFDLRDVSWSRRREDLPKTWLGTENPASWTVSLPSDPPALPLPYVIENGVVKLVKELDCEGLKVSIPSQLLVQDESAIQRSLWSVTLDLSKLYSTTYDDPVSMMTL